MPKESFKTSQNNNTTSRTRRNHCLKNETLQTDQGQNQGNTELKRKVTDNFQDLWFSVSFITDSNYISSDGFYASQQTQEPVVYTVRHFIHMFNSFFVSVIAFNDHFFSSTAVFQELLNFNYILHK